MRNSSGVSKALLWSAAGAGLLMFVRSQSVRESRLRGKVALVTGGSRGLGLVLARHLADEGARIAICARDEQELADARHDLQTRGADVFAIPCDLRNRDEVQTMVARVEAHFGAIDILINTAGIISVGPLEEMTIEDFYNAMDSNFWSGVYTSLSVLPGMRRRRSGRIVNITSSEEKSQFRTCFRIQQASSRSWASLEGFAAR